MIKSDLLYIEESILIDDLFKLCYQPSIVKSASVYDELGLSSIFSSLVEYFKQAFHWDEDVPGGFSVKLLNLMTPSLLFRANPLLGVIYLIGTSMFGVDLVDIIKSIIKKFSSNIDNKESISTSELQSATGLSAEAFKDELIILIKQAYQEQEFKKEAYGRYYGNEKSLDFPWMFTDKKAGLLQKLFGNLGALRGKKLIFGFAMWIVKSIFLSLGLLAVGGTAAKMLGIKPSHKSESQDSSQEEKDVTQSKPSSNIATHNMRESNQGTPNIWVVPLVGNKTVEDTLRIWTLDLYPELKDNPEIDAIIYKSTEFRDMVRLLKSDYKKISSTYLVMPENFKNRKQVVDQFIDDVKRNIK